jgi:cold shock CspA family protein
MAKSKQTSLKKEKEKKRMIRRKEKDQKREERKAAGKRSYEDMIAYVDENGQFSATPPDPRDRVELKLEDIQLGARKVSDEDSAPVRNSGRITYYNAEKGYGFIKDSRTKQSLFFSLNNAPAGLKINDVVSYDVNQGTKGPVATSLTKG